MRTTIAFRVAAALTLVTGMTAAGATAAWANSDGLELPDLSVGCSVPLVGTVCPDDENTSTPAPAPTQSQDTGPSGGGTSSGGDTTPATPAPAAPAPAPAPAAPAPAPAAPAPAAPAPAAGAQPAPSSSAPSGSSSPRSSSATSDVPATVTAQPAVPVAPQGPVLTQVESQASTRALEEARETLPTTVEPNTRLLAGNASSNGSLLPSPDDSGLLALIVAMGVASAGCAAAAVVLRKRSRPRHVARPGSRA